MSRTVDKRIVDMGFENKGFEKGIKESSSSLKDFNDALEKTSGGGSKLGALGGIAQGITSKFSILGTIATGALLRIGSQAVITGQQVIKSLTLDQVMAGFQEYELKINSIKTMLAGGRTEEGLPVTLEMVNKELEELNRYADQTIYSFSDMTSNIGKFTNAGVDLKLAVQSIKGISNAAALSGANTNEASRAMYNFAQALSAGYVKFIDWKSIENANMATVEFKEQLLNSAVAAGTLEKSADGMYKVLTGGGNGGELISATRGFNQSLQDQWMTTEVLTGTLRDYADVTTDIGARATEAATKVRTWSQLVDTVKEALGSGWGVSFEKIFGDYNEATELWTEVSEAIGAAVEKSSAGRNEMLDQWRNWGGRDAIIQGVRSAFDSLGRIFRKVGAAFSEVFPEPAWKNLVRFSHAFHRLMVRLEPSPKTLIAIRRIFVGFFSALSLGWKTVSAVFKGLADGIKAIFESFPKGEGDGILGFFANIADFFTDLNKAAEDGEFFAKVSEGISDALVGFVDKIVESYNKIKNSKVGEVIGNIFQALKDAISGLVGGADLEGASSFLDGIKSFFENFSFLDTLLNILGPVAELLEPIGLFLVSLITRIKEAIAGVWETEGLSGFVDIIGVMLQGGILVGIKELVTTLTGLSDSAGDIAGGVSGVFGSLGSVLKSYQDNLKSKQLVSIAIAIGILAASVLALSFVNPSKLESATTALAVLFLQLGASFAVLQKTMGGKDLTKMALQLMGISAAILLMSVALRTIASIPADRLTDAILALGAVLLELVVFSKLMSGTKGFMAAAVALIALGVAINIIVLAVRALGKLDPAQLNQGLVAIGLIALGMAAFAVTVSQLSKGGNLLAAAVAMNIIAVALLQIAGIVALIGMLDPATLSQGLMGLGIILAEIAAFSIVISQTINPANLLAAAASMAIMGAAILAMTGAVFALGSMSGGALTQGLIGLAAGLLIMTGSLLLLSNPTVLIGAAAMMLISAAILVMTPALVALSNVPMEGIGKALLFLAGVFIVIGAAAALLTPLIPSILGLAGAIALLGIGVLAIGAGLMLFGAGLAALSAGGTAAIALLIFAIQEVIKLLPFILTKVGEAVVALANVIIEGAPAIAGALVAVFSALITLLAGELPKLIEVILIFIVELVETLVEQVPKFVDAAMRLILGFLEGINNNIGAVVEAIVDLVINILDALSEKLPELIRSGADLILAVLDGITTEVPRVIDAAFQMIIDFINGLAEAIETNTPLILEAVANLATAFIDGVKAYLNIDEGESIAGNIISGLVSGVNAGVNLVISAVEGLGKAVIAGVKAILGIHSPSSEFEDIGEDSDLGFIKGIKKFAGKVTDAATGVGEQALDALRRTMSGLSDVIDSDLNDSPVITPVLDLNQIQSGANTLNALLGHGQTYGLAASQIEADRIVTGENQNGSNQLINGQGQSIINEFNLNGITIRTEADIEKIAEKLYRKQESAMRSRGMKPSYT